MNKKKIQFTNMLLLLTLNGINVFGMDMNNPQITNKKKEQQMSKKDFLNKIYEDVYEIYSAFRILNLSFYISLEKKNKDILIILEIIMATIDNKEQFENKTPTEILMTTIPLGIKYKEKKLNLFLDQDFFINIMQKAILTFSNIINNSLFPQLKFFKEIINDQFNLFLLIKDGTIKVFESILKYLTTMKNFIIDALEENNQLQLTLLKNIEYLEQQNQEKRTKIEVLQNIKLTKEIKKEIEIQEENELLTLIEISRILSISYREIIILADIDIKNIIDPNKEEKARFDFILANIVIKNIIDQNEEKKARLEFILANIGIKTIIDQNEETIEKEKMSTEDFLKKIYKDFLEIKITFQRLDNSFYIPLEKDNQDILEILKIIMMKIIYNKKQFKNKNPTEILMTTIPLIKKYQKKELNIFLDQDFFMDIIKNTKFMFYSIINSDLFPQLKFFTEMRNNQINLFLLIKDDTIKIFESILKYLTTIENFILDSLEKDNKLKLLKNIEYLKEKTQEEIKQYFTTMTNFMHDSFTEYNNLKLTLLEHLEKNQQEIQQYFQIIENFIHDFLKENNDLKLIFLKSIEYLKEKNLNEKNQKEIKQYFQIIENFIHDSLEEYHNLKLQFLKIIEYLKKKNQKKIPEEYLIIRERFIDVSFKEDHMLNLKFLKSIEYLEKNPEEVKKRDERIFNNTNKQYLEKI